MMINDLVGRANIDLICSTLGSDEHGHLGSKLYQPYEISTTKKFFFILTQLPIKIQTPFASGLYLWQLPFSLL